MINKSGEFVVPGNKLGVIEEFIPSLGTYVEEGVIYSRIIGRILFDYANRKVTVYPSKHMIRVPVLGSIVTGKVKNIQRSMLNINIFRVEKKMLTGSFTGLLHVSDIRQRYTEKTFDEFAVGDIVRAKVISDLNRVYHLSTKEPDLGIILGFCLKCGQPHYIYKRMLKCSECGKIEKRKIAIPYGDLD